MIWFDLIYCFVRTPPPQRFDVIAIIQTAFTKFFLFLVSIDYKMTEGISDWTLGGEGVSGGPKSQNMDILHRGRRDRNKSTSFWYMFLIFGMWGHIDMKHKMTEGNFDWPLGQAGGGVTKFNISKYCLRQQFFLVSGYLFLDPRLPKESTHAWIEPMIVGFLF